MNKNTNYLDFKCCEKAGGQVFRYMLSLSVHLKQPIKLSNIRAGRPVPGLSRSHLLTLLATIINYGGSTLNEPQKRDIEIVFDPSLTNALSKSYTDVDLKINTGSNCLMLQSQILQIVSRNLKNVVIHGISYGSF